MGLLDQTARTTQEIQQESRQRIAVLVRQSLDQIRRSHHQLARLIDSNPGGLSKAEVLAAMSLEERAELATVMAKLKAAANDLKPGSVI